jgi:hypothetical protein
MSRLLAFTLVLVATACTAADPPGDDEPDDAGSDGDTISEDLDNGLEDAAVDAGQIDALQEPAVPDMGDVIDAEVLDMAVEPDAAVCVDQDEDGLQDCEGDCDDGDGFRRPGFREVCNNIDDDCDGQTDEGCGSDVGRGAWNPVAQLPGPAPATCPAGLRYADEGDVECNASGLRLGPMALGDWFNRRQRGEAPAGGNLAYATLELPPLQDFRVEVSIRIDEADPPDRVLDGQVFGTVGLVFEGEEPTGGFPGTITSLVFLPNGLPRFYYQGGPSSGGGHLEVELGRTVELSIERIGHDLITRVGGAYSNRRVVPDGGEGDRPLDPHRPLRRLVLACVNCRGTIEKLRVLTPTVAPVVDLLAPCPNQLRNGGFESATEQTAHFWSVRPAEITAAECCEAPSAEAWRRSLNSVRLLGDAGARRMVFDPPAAGARPAPLVQPTPAIAEESLRTLSLSASSEAPATLKLGLEGCEPNSVSIEVPGPEQRFDRQFRCDAWAAPEVRIWNEDPVAVVVDDVQLEIGEPSGFCPSWRDGYGLRLEPSTQIEPVDIRPDEITRHPIAEDLELALEADGAGLRISVIGALGDLDLKLSPWPGRNDHSTLRLRNAVHVVDGGEVEACGEELCPDGGLVWILPWEALQLDATTQRNWGLELLRPNGEVWSTTSIYLYWVGELPWGNSLADPPEYRAAAPAPAWADQIRTWVLHPRRVGPESGQVVTREHFDLFRDLGFDGVGLVNPHVNELPRFFEFAGGENPITVDLQTFYGLRFWRNDDHFEFYLAYADAIAGAMEQCGEQCPPVHWTLMDEPSIHALSRCRQDLSTSDNWADLRPSMRAALLAGGCIADQACDSSTALVACRAAFPTLINELVAEVQLRLPESVPVGINITRDLGLALLSRLGESLDDLSFTNNWVGVDHPWAISLDPFRRRVEEAPNIPFIGYNAIGGPSGGWFVRGGPSAQAYRGMSLLLTAWGAVALRAFVWPPHSVALLDELRDSAALFQRLAPTIPRGRLTPRPATSHRRLFATAFRDLERTLLVVVNVGDAPLQGRIDVRGFDGAQFRRIDIDDEAQPHHGRIQGHWAPFEGRVFQILD